MLIGVNDRIFLLTEQAALVDTWRALLSTAFRPPAGLAQSTQDASLQAVLEAVWFGEARITDTPVHLDVWRGRLLNFVVVEIFLCAQVLPSGFLPAER